MAKNIIGQVVGGTKKVIDLANTVGEVRNQLGVSSTYKAAVNGEPASNDSQTLRDQDYVSFSEAVKAAR
jgi:hypothetical protein